MSKRAESGLRSLAIFLILMLIFSIGGVKIGIESILMWCPLQFALGYFTYRGKPDETK